MLDLKFTEHNTMFDEHTQINEIALGRAKNILDKIRNIAPNQEPSISIGPDDTVDLHWRLGDVEILANVHGDYDKHIDFYCDVNYGKTSELSGKCTDVEFVKLATKLFLRRRNSNFWAKTFLNKIVSRLGIFVVSVYDENDNFVRYEIRRCSTNAKLV